MNSRCARKNSTVLAVLGTLVLTGCLQWRGLQALSIGRGTHLSVFAFQLARYLLFSGLLVLCLRRVWSPPLAVLAAALLFGLAHLAPVMLLAVAASVGLPTLALFLRHGFWAAFGWHLAWNLLLGPVFGVTLAGVRIIGWLDTDLSGPVFLTGGAYGPEGGLVACLVGGLLVGLLLRSRPETARG